MKIAFVTSEYITESNFDGGLANYLGRTCRALRDLGHEPLVIVGTSENGYIEDDGIPVHRVDVVHHPLLKIIRSNRYTRTYYQVFTWLLMSWKLKKRIMSISEKENIDILHYTSDQATAFFRFKLIPSVVRISSIYSQYHRAYEIPFSPAVKWLQYIQDKSLLNADRVIAPSIRVAKDQMDRLGIDVTVIESPYIPSWQNEDPVPFHDLLENKRYVLFFGTLGLMKGVKTIADGISSLLNRHRDLFFVFIGKDIGYSGEPMMKYVWEKAKSARGRVLFLGVMKHSQLMPIIRGAEAVVLPSLIDYLPNTCIEAMAQGQIVIRTKGASFEQLIENNYNGFLCNIDDPEDLNRSIDSALSLTTEEKIVMRKRAKERIDAMKPELVVQDLINVYKSIVKIN